MEVEDEEDTAFSIFYRWFSGTKHKSNTLIALNLSFLLKIAGLLFIFMISLQSCLDSGSSLATNYSKYETTKSSLKQA